LIVKGHSCDEASFEVINAYLAGKPTRAKKKIKINKEDLFWSSKILWNFSAEVLSSDDFVLALSKYFTQDSTSNYDLLKHVAQISPRAIGMGIRRSEIVLRPKSEKWVEVNKLGAYMPDELSELIKVCEQFKTAHRQRQDLLDKCQEPFKKLSIFELLSYSSLYAFRGFVKPSASLDGDLISVSSQFRAMTKILEWKLSIAEPTLFKLTDKSIADSLKIHLSPIVFPSNEDSTVPDVLLHRFSELVQVQVELDEFLSRCVVPFCFEEEKIYVLNGSQLALTALNDKEDKAWKLNGRKLTLLDGYWFNRGLAEFIDLGMAEKQIGSKDNHEQNQTAYIKALGSVLQLNEIYGLDETVSTDNGMDVNIFQALLSLELMIAFYSKDYVEVFYREYDNTGHWQGALGMLAMSGLRDQSSKNFQNRFPITWNNWKQKAKDIVGWTVSDVFPNGNLNAAEAILDFWSLDFKKWSIALKNNNTQNLPELTERPMLKLGNYCIQLPWMMANQLSGVNIINNLRRFANKRAELKSETSRIEDRLGASFKKRGFTVLANYMPENWDGFNPGEIDLICKLDGVVLVIEVKSTYRRNSQREAIGYKNNALRKAGIQIKRKTEAVEHLLLVDAKFRLSLGIDKTERCNVIGWIADTSVEFDHEYFNGFLKVSIEELHIALTDDAELLVDITKLGWQGDNDDDLASLYQEGFGIESFVDVIDHSKVWGSILEQA
jgi:Holliday junction resolvase-like predicted endonuclease